MEGQRRSLDGSEGRGIGTSGTSPAGESTHGGGVLIGKG